MDQSNATQAAETSEVYKDQQVRYTALQFATSAENRVEGNGDKVIHHARKYYLFLTGADPVIDIKYDLDALDDDPSDTLGSLVAEIMADDEAQGCQIIRFPMQKNAFLEGDDMIGLMDE